MTLRILTLLCFAPAILFGQELKEPFIWTKVRYNHVNNQYVEPRSSTKSTSAYWDFLGGPDGVNRWMVHASKTGAPVYESRKDTLNPSRTLNLGESFYVQKEKKEWLKLLDEEMKEVGWVHKRHLVLWNHPLVDYITGVEVKAFFVNDYKKGKRLIEQDFEQYKVYDRPGAGKIERESRYIYDVLFVYKYIKPEGSAEGQYLVSNLYNLQTAAMADDRFFGWVSENRLRLWTTALCLEPNWDPEARDARANAGVQANILVADEGQAEGFVESCEGTFIFRTPERTAADDIQPRMRKDLMRYPVFGGQRIGDRTNCTFETGASGKVNYGNAGKEEGMTESAYLKWRDVLKDLEERTDINIIFVVDATETMGWVKNGFSKWLGSIDGGLREDDILPDYGMVVYKGTPDDSGVIDPQGLDAHPLTKNPSDLTNWFNQRSDVQWGTAGESLANEALIKAVDLLPRERSTNIIVHLGNTPDITSRFMYSGPHEDALERLLDGIATEEMQFHYAHFTPHFNQNEDNESKTSNAIREEVIQEFKTFYTRVFSGINWQEYRITPPTYAEVATDLPPSGMRYDIPESPVILREVKYGGWPQNQLPQDITNFIRDAVAKSEELKSTLENLLGDQSPLKDKAGALSPAAIGQLQQLGLTEDANFDDLVAQKAHLFFDGIVPQFVSCTGDTPLFKLVLFIPEERLRSYAENLGELLSELKTGTLESSTQAMSQLFNQLTDDMLGGPSGSGNSIKKINLNELNMKLNGLEGLDIILPQSLSGGDIAFLGEINLRDLRKGSIKEKYLNDYKKLIGENKKELDQILQDGFCYEIEGTGDKYYWVPLEYYFN